MRHVSRTHRVSLDWLLDRINLDPKIQIRYIDTKHQMVDVLTKEDLTRDERNNLLYLFNISHFSSLCSAKNLSLLSCTTERMAQRMEEQSEENRIVAESRPMVMNLTTSVATSSSFVESPIASRSQGILKTSTGKLDASANQNSNSDAASSSQGWQRDAQLFLCTGKLVATNTDQNSLNRREESLSTGKLVAMMMNEHQGCSGKSKVPEDSGGSEPKSRILPHNLHVSPDYVPHMGKVFSIVRKIYDRKPTDNLKDLDVNTAIWGISMSVTLHAAVHLGRDYSINLRSVKNQSSMSVKQMFCSTEKFIQEQMEIAGLSTIDWDQLMCKESSLLCDGTVRIMKSRTYVLSDSVLCLGGSSPEPAQAWKDKWNGIWKNAISKNWIKLMEM